MYVDKVRNSFAGENVASALRAKFVPRYCSSYADAVRNSFGANCLPRYRRLYGLVRGCGADVKYVGANCLPRYRRLYAGEVRNMKVH